MPYRRCLRYLIHCQGNRFWIKADSPQEAKEEVARTMRVRRREEVVILDVQTRMIWED